MVRLDDGRANKSAVVNPAGFRGHMEAHLCSQHGHARQAGRVAAACLETCRTVMAAV